MESYFNPGGARKKKQEDWEGVFRKMEGSHATDRTTSGAEMDNKWYRDFKQAARTAPPTAEQIESFYDGFRKTPYNQQRLRQPHRRQQYKPVREISDTIRKLHEQASGRKSVPLGPDIISIPSKRTRARETVHATIDDDQGAPSAATGRSLSHMSPSKDIGRVRLSVPTFRSTQKRRWFTLGRRSAAGVRSGKKQRSTGRKRTTRKKRRKRRTYKRKAYRR